jgi:hypothetical protein
MSDAYKRPTDAAIAEAQAAYDRGEVGLLEATFLADALSVPQDEPETEEPTT